MISRSILFCLLVVAAILPGIIISSQALQSARASLVSAIDNEGWALATTLKYGDLSFVLAELAERARNPRAGDFVALVKEGRDDIYAPLHDDDRRLLEPLQPGDLVTLKLLQGQALVRQIDLEQVPGLDPAQFSDTRIYVGRYLDNPQLTSVRNLIIFGLFGYAALIGFALGIYSWYRQRYVRALNRINLHLRKVGDPRFELLENTGSAQEVRVLTQNINQMILRLKSFLSGLISLNGASVAHDVRTPLTLLRIGVGQLRRDISAEEFETQKQKVLDRIEELTARFDSIFELAQERASAGSRSNFSTFDLVQLAEGVIDDYVPLVSEEGKQISFRSTCPGDLMICGDGNGVRRLLENLINNARKYSPAGADIRLALEEHNAGFMLAVSNTGSTFPEDVRRTAFEAESRSRFVEHIEGLGLGLNHVRTIAAKHGWGVAISDRSDIAEVVVTGTITANDCGMLAA